MLKRGQTETTIAAPEAEAKEEKDDWVSTVPPELLETLPRSEVNRQTYVLSHILSLTRIGR